MLRKHPRQEMVKTSLWMHKNEFAKIAELSGDISLNLFVMRAVRKAIAATEAEHEQDEERRRRSKEPTRGIIRRKEVAVHKKMEEDVKE